MKVLGIHGGNGVILYPFKKYLIGNIETRSIFHTPGNEQWNENFEGIPLYKKIPEEIERPDVIIGAPDCGHSSILALSRAKKYGKAKDNPSLNNFLNLTKRLRPKFFYMENLPALLDQFTKKEFREHFDDYSIIFHQEPVAWWGNSQKTRIRLVMIGIRKDMTKFRKSFRSQGKIPKLKTCKELLEDLPSNGHVTEPIDKIITMYSGYKISLLNVQNYWKINPEEKRWKVIDRKFSTAPAVYRNRDQDFPATARKANRHFNAQGLQMSPRELARVQDVPDHYKIYINKEKEQYWINKGRATVTKTPPMNISYWFLQKLLNIFSHEN